MGGLGRERTPWEHEVLTLTFKRTGNVLRGFLQPLEKYDEAGCFIKEPTSRPLEIQRVYVTQKFGLNRNMRNRSVLWQGRCEENAKL